MKSGLVIIIFLAIHSKNHCQTNDPVTYNVISEKKCFVYKSNLKDTVCKPKDDPMLGMFLISLFTKAKDTYQFSFIDNCNSTGFSYLFLKDNNGIYRNQEKYLSFKIITTTINTIEFILTYDLNPSKPKDPLKRIEYYYCETLK